ncbi:hypothetical protein E4T63_11525 [Pseudomonas fluorescens]|uniref:Uncharacterized protein n=1 Tax=Pseudomonas fluorescens TaxID=294 RepID=A0AAP8YZF9_PSEFL|nr:hypothetical protein E4T63_11525 [Pseudomonas fluorescens]
MLTSRSLGISPPPGVSRNSAVGVLAGALCQAITQSHCLTDNPCGSGLARECGVSFKAMLPDTPTSRASPLPQG